MTDEHEEEIELELSDEELRLVQREADTKGVTVDSVISDLIRHQFIKDDLTRAMKTFRVSMTTIIQHKNGNIASSAEAACQELSSAVNKCCVINFTTPIDAMRNLQLEQKRLIASVEMAFWLALIDTNKERSEFDEN